MTQSQSVTTLLCVFVMVTVSGAERSGSPEVTTQYGKLRGTRTMLAGQSSSYVDVFYGIPYAKPPVGHLRFKNPEVTGGWPGTRDASTPGPVCSQIPYYPPVSLFTPVGQEDCLFLNVYTPQLSNTTGAYPVMVFIHGGGFMQGAANWYNGTQLASKGVVVVTVNYRLGPFGFLSTEDDVSIGNYGLRDVILALKWVRDVISSFNGDGQDVTIFGESAGSATISLLILSAEAKGLFSKAIMQSGVSLSPWAVGYPSSHPSPSDNARGLAAILQCDVTSSRALVGCLRHRNVTAILNAAFKLTGVDLILFRPVPEPSFGQRGLLSAVPSAILRSGAFSHVTVLRGFNKDEMAFGLDDVAPEGLTMQQFEKFTRTFIHTSFAPEHPGIDTDRVMALVKETYVTQPQISSPGGLRSAYVQIMSDFWIIASTLKETALYAAAGGGTQYLYRFSYRSPNRLNRLWHGVTHSDELSYVFGYPVANETFEKGFVSSWANDDILTSQRLMTLWTNFAKNGTPTPQGSTVTQWLPWIPATPRYLDLGLQPSMASAPETPMIHLWNSLIPSLAGGQLIG